MTDTDHLPECPLATACKHDYYDEPPIQCADCGEECFCDRLRACEKRVADDIWGAIREGSQYKSGFEGGLDAAREAVAALPKMKIAGNFPLIDADDAISAIDALLNDSSNNGTKVQGKANDEQA